MERESFDSSVDVVVLMMLLIVIMMDLYSSFPGFVEFYPSPSDYLMDHKLFGGKLLLILRFINGGSLLSSLSFVLILVESSIVQELSPIADLLEFTFGCQPRSPESSSDFDVDLCDESGKMDQSDYSRLAESMAEFLKQQTKSLLIQYSFRRFSPSYRSASSGVKLLATPFIIKRVLQEKLFSMAVQFGNRVIFSYTSLTSRFWNALPLMMMLRFGGIWFQNELTEGEFL